MTRKANRLSVAVASVITSSFLLSSPTYAEKSHFQIQGFLGASWLSMTDDVDLVLSPIERDTLHPNNNAAAFLYGGGLGYVFPICTTYKRGWSFFPAITAAANFYGFEESIKGDVWQFGLPELNNYDFNMKIQSYRAMFDVTLDLVKYNSIKWFILGGVGASWNKVTYKDFADDGIPYESHVYLKSHQNNNFTWQLGTGLSYIFNDEVQVRLSYLYTDFGELRTSDQLNTPYSVIDPLIEPASFNFHTNSFVAALVYSFK